MIALLEARRAGLLGRRHWLPNIVSGIIVGIVALPLAMAFAIASGAKPEQGLYTAIVAGLLVSCVGGSRVQIAGPTGAFIVILSAITAQYGIGGLQIATMMAGAMLLLLGLTRLGNIIKFIPDPVITGFTAGIAVIIWVGQWQYFFGLPAPEGAHFHEKFWQLLLSLPEFHPATTGLSILALLLVTGAPRVPGLKRVPGPAVALAVVTALQAVFHFNGVVTVGSAFGGIRPGLPAFEVPQVTLTQLLELIRPAFAIAMLGGIESLLSAVVADGMTGVRHDSNQELVGQGIANIAAPLFGGFAATGAIARTATNIRNGGSSPLAGIVHAATLILVLLFLAPLAVHIPLAVLAAILFAVAWNMSEAGHFLRMVRRAPRADTAVLLITFGLTVFVDLIVAVNIGVILATLHFLSRMSMSVEVLQLNGRDLSRESADPSRGELPPGLRVYSVEGPFFFGAVETFERALVGARADLKTLIIHLKRVPFIDITGLQTLEEIIRDMHRHGIRVILTGANARVTGKLEKAGVVRQIGRENFFPEIDRAIADAASRLAPLNATAPTPLAAQSGGSRES
jgi:SulP family sulfate permease